MHTNVRMSGQQCHSNALIRRRTPDSMNCLNVLHLHPIEFSRERVIIVRNVRIMRRP